MVPQALGVELAGCRPHNCGIAGSIVRGRGHQPALPGAARRRAVHLDVAVPVTWAAVVVAVAVATAALRDAARRLRGGAGGWIRMRRRLGRRRPRRRRRRGRRRPGRGWGRRMRSGRSRRRGGRGGGPSRRRRRDGNRCRLGRDRRALGRYRGGANAEADRCADRRDLPGGHHLGDQPVPARSEVPVGEHQPPRVAWWPAIEDEPNTPGAVQPHARQQRRANRRPRSRRDDGDRGRSGRDRRWGGLRADRGRRNWRGRSRGRVRRSARGHQAGNRHHTDGGGQSHPRAWSHGGSRTKTPRPRRSFPRSSGRCPGP